MAVRFTRADFKRLPEGFPAQLIGGMLVKEACPTYGHQLFAGRLYGQLVSLVGHGRAIHAPQDVGIDEWNVFQPDLLVVRQTPSLDAHDVGIPMLAVEVLSPTTARRDRGVKTRRLLNAGTVEVWLVDPIAKTVEVHDAAGIRSAAGNERLSSNAVPGFEVVPSKLFEPP